MNNNIKNINPMGTHGSTMYVSKEVVESLRSSRGSFTRDVVELFGEDWNNLEKGWTSRVIGRSIFKRLYDEFIEHKRHEPKKRRGMSRDELESDLARASGERIHVGNIYKTGCLKGDYWICRIWRREGMPDVHMEYEWGSSLEDVLSKKGICAPAQGELFS